MIFDHGLVHADPHPGNIHVKWVKNKNGKEEPKVVLLDHGIYNEISDTTRKGYAKMWRGIFA
jgi:aarF domain-containing kinase